VSDHEQIEVNFLHLYTLFNTIVFLQR